MKSLIEQQIREMDQQKYSYACGSNGRRQKRWLFELTPEEFEKAEDIPGEVKEIIVDLPFNSKMMEIFQGSNIEEILEKMFAYIKTQIENPKLAQSWLYPR